MRKAIVGAGGKTSLIRKLAKEYRDLGQRVFVTTSTHMEKEAHTLVTDDADIIIEALENKGYAMAGTDEGIKIGPLSYGTYEKVCQYADVVLVEADGANHKAIKFPREGEPVIYDNVDEIVVVCGLHAIGKKAAEAAHRLELVKECLNIKDDTIINAEHIQKLVMKGYVEPMKEQWAKKQIVIEPNHDDSLYQRAVAQLMRAGKDVSILKEEWFAAQPELLICGAGHISCELVKMASCLDFHIKVIDDRDMFVTEERFPAADERICDSFENLKQYVEPNAYCVVVTRGHKDDYSCVKTILSVPHQYLGMIGSKKKVATVFENLRQEGVEEEKIKSIFAPIGLDIKAATPAEIAVSILAEIIAEKNKDCRASVSKELLENKTFGILCIIVEKTGSTPRGVGSMMLVTESEIIDSIGGGAIEFAVIEEARHCSEVMMKEYQLDNEKSRELGMVCGGTNKVLFIPV